LLHENEIIYRQQVRKNGGENRTKGRTNAKEGWESQGTKIN
jgi:hypothetical protein